MKPFPFLSTLLLIFAANLAGAQDEEKKNALSLYWGAASLDRQDLIFSPFVHTDFSPLHLGLEYQREELFRHELSIQFTSFSPQYRAPYTYSEFGEPKTAGPGLFTLISLDYLFGKRVQHSKRSRIYLGGALLTEIQSLNYVYGRIGNFGYYSTIGLGVFAKYSLRLLDKQLLSAQLQLPLLSWLSRSPYSVNDDEYIENTVSHNDLETLIAFIADGHLASWGKLQYGDLDLSYTYLLNEHWSIGAGYNFSLIHATEPRNLLSKQSSFQLTGTIKF